MMHMTMNSFNTGYFTSNPYHYHYQHLPYYHQCQLQQQPQQQQLYHPIQPITEMPPSNSFNEGLNQSVDMSYQELNNKATNSMEVKQETTHADAAQQPTIVPLGSDNQFTTYMPTQYTPQIVPLNPPDYFEAAKTNPMSQPMPINTQFHRQVSIEDIFKRNTHLWNLYKSGRFEVKQFYEKTGRKIILKEKINSYDIDDYVITKYKVYINRIIKSNNEQVLCVSFVNCQTNEVINEEFVEVGDDIQRMRMGSEAAGCCRSKNCSSTRMNKSKSKSPIHTTSATINKADSHSCLKSLSPSGATFAKQLAGPGSELVTRLIDDSFNYSPSISLGAMRG